MTLAKRNTCSISSFFGPGPIHHAGQPLFWLSGASFSVLGLAYFYLYQNSMHLPSYDTLLMRQVLRLTTNHPVLALSGTRG
jgi:hypothetical protein